MDIWEKYSLPENKRIHVTLVAQVSGFLGKKLEEFSRDIQIDSSTLRYASLLHDIDKNVVRLPGEIHPDTAVRILQEEELPAIARIVKTHSLYAILDAGIMPTTWEEKVLYLADKMVKYSIITVDKRFDLWRKEDLPDSEMKKLDECYPLVKKLEIDIFSRIHTAPEQVAISLL